MTAVSDVTAMTKLASAVDNLTAKLSSLQSEICGLKANANSGKFYHVRRGSIIVNKRFYDGSSRNNFKYCISKGQQRCNHCFSCGSPNHIMWQCKSDKANPLPGKGN